jgi:hypothetical protein
MLRLENAFDRMAGFDPHVRRVVTTVFSKVDDHARQRLGFALSDSLAFGSLYGQVRMAHADRANDFMANCDRPASFAGGEGELRWAMAHMTLYALHSAPPLEGGPLDDELASNLGLTQEQFADLVEAMSTKLGSVAPARVVGDASIRTKPLLRLSSGEWMWIRPIDFVHGAMEWALEVCKKDQNLLQKFDTARQSAAEDLTANLLEEVFGREYVFRNVTYPDTESDAESDTIVALPGVVLLVETKGGRFSAPGRRAAPLRVEKHAKELVEAAADQNQRTANVIANDKPMRDKGGRIVPTQPTDAVVPIIVTLDRVDPFSTFLGQPRDGAQEERNWVLNLADLVMLADVLSSPEEFVGYAMKRLQMVRDHVRVFVEADCLGNWCEDRTARVTELSDSFGRSIRMVSETAEGMNDYFTQETIDAIDPEAGRQRRRVLKPSAGIPTQVLDALRAERASGSRQWPALVDHVAHVAPKAWRPVERLLAALSRRGGRAPTRQLTKSIRRAESGWTVDGRVEVTLISPEPAVVGLSLPNDSDGTTG